MSILETIANHAYGVQYDEDQGLLVIVNGSGIHTFGVTSEPSRENRYSDIEVERIHVGGVDFHSHTLKAEAEQKAQRYQTARENLSAALERLRNTPETMRPPGFGSVLAAMDAAVGILYAATGLAASIPAHRFQECAEKEMERYQRYCEHCSESIEHDAEELTTEEAIERALSTSEETTQAYVYDADENEVSAKRYVCGSTACLREEMESLQAIEQTDDGNWIESSAEE